MLALLRPRWQKVAADLWNSKLRSLLVIASIAVGLFAIGMISSMQVMITDDMEVGYASISPANIQMTVRPLDQQMVDLVRKLPDVRQAEGAALVSLQVKGANGQWQPISLRAIADIEEMQINRVTLLEGRWPPAEHEIAIDRYKLGDLPVGVGNEIEIKLNSGKIRKLKLVGVVNDQTIGAAIPGGFFFGSIQGYITLDTLEWLEIAPSPNTLYVTLAGDGLDTAGMRSIANQVREEIEESGAVVSNAFVRASNDHPNRVYVTAIDAILWLLTLMVVFLSSVLITNTLMALLNQQVHMVGVMKIIGARQGQVMSIYMLLIFIYGLVAFAIAMPLASQASYALLGLLTSPLNILLRGYRVVPQAVILQLSIALVIPQAAGFIPILHGTRVAVVEALSSHSQARTASGKSRLKQHRPHIRGISRPLLLSLRNTFRRRGRLILTLSTLTLGGAIFIATFNVQSSLSSYIARMGKYFLSDVNIRLDRPYRISEIQGLLLSLPEVKIVEGWSGAESELILPDGTIGDSLHLIAPPSSSKLVEPMMIEGRWIIPGDSNALVVNEHFRESFPAIQVGDSVRLRIAGKEYEVVVVGFFQMAGKLGGYLGYTDYEYISRLTHTANRAAAYRIGAARRDLTQAEQEALGNRVEALLAERGIAVATIETGQSLNETSTDGLNILTLFLLIMALLIALVGSIGLAGTMSLNVLERTREIGIMRAIGASDRIIINQVLVEGMLIGLMSWLLGTLASFPISTLLSNALNFALFGAAAEITFTPFGVVLWLFLVLVLSAGASILPARNAVRLTIREVLAYE